MDVSPYVGKIVNHSYDPGFIFLSYLVSLTGCWTSLELLHRRTSARGYYNWYLLLAAASTMGAVAIWSMHYIGNRAILMDEDQKELQIQYSPGFTAGSFFLPICVVGVAFYLFSIYDSVSILGTMAGGLLTGLAVCGMHYMGQGGISNYTPSYSWPYVLGSAIIAVTATTIALGVFFYLKSTWTNNWLKRGCCASLLALAVSGMHWIATVGTEYRLDSNQHVTSMTGLSREATVIVVICLGIGCCLALITFTLIGQRSRQRSADRAQQVVLACATFDKEGRLMVTPDGLLPCRKITDSYIERSFESVFDVDHPIFHWIYRASRCWHSIADLLPSMRTHLRNANHGKMSRRLTLSESRSSSSVDSTGNYPTMFKELFCIAANDLADLVQEPFANIGVLFGTIMSTGTLSKSSKLQYFRDIVYKPNNLDNAEKGQSPVLFGRGQLLFLVRRVARLESSRLQASGHRFATIHNVVDSLARSMEVTQEELLPQLERMRDYSENEHALHPGVHLACFALRPIFHRGFDVLVHKNASNLLPTSQLSSTKLEQRQLEILEKMDNWTVATCLERLRGRSLFGNQGEQQFIRNLFEGISELAEKISNPFFEDARLIARPMLACTSSSHGAQPQQHAYVVAFRVITDAYQKSSLNGQYEFVPSKFFLCQQHAYKDCPDNEVFARRIHREFAAIAEYDAGSGTSPSQSFYRPSDSSSPPCRGKRRPSRIRDDNLSEKSLVGPSSKGSHGAIHVTNEIDVDVSETRAQSRSPDIEMRSLGVYTEAAVGDIDEDSFADELMALTTDERRKQRTGFV